jgi:hypothetical protein
MPSKTTPGRQRRFLEAYAECGVISEAARQADIDRTMHYDWLADPEYKANFEAAQHVAGDSLETELFKRVYEGVDEEVTDFDGKTRTTRRFSDTLLIFALKAAKPDKYRDNYKQEIQLNGNLALSRGPDLSRLTNEQLVILEQLALAAAAGIPAIAGSGEDPAGEGAESDEQDPDVLPG